LHSLILSLVVLLFVPTCAYSSESETANTMEGKINEPFFGDLPQIRERNILRVVVSQSRTNFFYTPKGIKGLEYDLLKAYETFLNRGPRQQRYKTHVAFIPLPFEQILDQLTQGRADIAAAGLTINDERKAFVDFTKPYINNINEILVTHKSNNSQISTLEDLAGEKILVLANSSYVVQLQKLNQFLGMQALEPIEVIQADPILDSADILELINSEVIKYTVIDSHLAQLYEKQFDNLKLIDSFIFRHNGQIGWAVNKNTPKLLNSLNTFIESYAKQGRFLRNSIYRKYFENDYWIKRPLTTSLLSKKPCLEYYFDKYATFFDFDPFLIHALAYQESRFRSNLESHVGAYGIMQIKPSTARIQTK